MTTSRGARAIAAAALLLVAMTSCANDGQDPAANASPTPSSSTPTPTATATPPSDTELASEAASATLRKYYDVRNQLRQNPSRPLSLLDQVAISTELAAQRRLTSLRSSR